MPAYTQDESYEVSDGSYGGTNLFPPQILERIYRGCDNQGWRRPTEKRNDNDPRPLGPGCSVGKGWLDIIVELDKKLAEIDPDYEVHQIKEKFGGLRYYTKFNFDSGRRWDNENCKEVIYDPEAYAVFEKFHALIDEAYNKSEETCEICGEPGKISGQRWLKCRCETHR